MIVLWPEIREVKDPLLPAHAFTENGRTVIEVDEKLKGKERSKAILAAWREHERGLAAVVALPVLAYLWEPFKRWAAHHPLTAMAVGITYGGALVLAVTTLMEQQDRPIVTPHSVTESPSVTVGSPVWTPERSPIRVPMRSPHTSPKGLPDRSTPIPPPAQGTRRPDVTRRPSTKRPTPAATGSSPERRPSRAPLPSGTSSAMEWPTPTTPPEPTPQTSDSSSPPRPASSPDKECVLRVDADPLLTVCAL